jgi:hypothetical protein
MSVLIIAIDKNGVRRICGRSCHYSQDNKRNCVCGGILSGINHLDRPEQVALQNLDNVKRHIEAAGGRIHFVGIDEQLTLF